MLEQLTSLIVIGEYIFHPNVSTTWKSYEMHHLSHESTMFSLNEIKSRRNEAKPFLNTEHDWKFRRKWTCDDETVLKILLHLRLSWIHTISSFFSFRCSAVSHEKLLFCFTKSTSGEKRSKRGKSSFAEILAFFVETFFEKKYLHLFRKNVWKTINRKKFSRKK